MTLPHPSKLRGKTNGKLMRSLPSDCTTPTTSSTPQNRSGTSMPDILTYLDPRNDCRNGYELLKLMNSSLTTLTTTNHLSNRDDPSLRRGVMWQPSQRLLTFCYTRLLTAILKWFHIERFSWGFSVCFVQLTALRCLTLKLYIDSLSFLPSFCFFFFFFLKLSIRIQCYRMFLTNELCVI